MLAPSFCCYINFTLRTLELIEKMGKASKWQGWVLTGGLAFNHRETLTASWYAAEIWWK